MHNLLCKYWKLLQHNFSISVQNLLNDLINRFFLKIFFEVLLETAESSFYVEYVFTDV